MIHETSHMYEGSFFSYSVHFQSTDGISYEDIISSIHKIINAIENYMLPCDYYARSIAFVMCDKEFSCNLNNIFCKRNKPTNVLAFPSREKSELGDIVMCTEIIHEESIRYNKDFFHRFLHIALHGILHLYGFDHKKESERNNMEYIEITILSSIYINNPYDY